MATVELVRGFLQLIGLTEKQTPVDRLATKLEKKFSVTHAEWLVGDGDQHQLERSGRGAGGGAELGRAVHAGAYSSLGLESLYDFYLTRARPARRRFSACKQQLADKLNELGAVSIDEHLRDLARRINQLLCDRFYTPHLISSTGQPRHPRP